MSFISQYQRELPGLKLGFQFAVQTWNLSGLKKKEKEIKTDKKILKKLNTEKRNDSKWGELISYLITNARQRKTFWNPIRSRYLNLWIPLAYGPPLMSYREIFSELGHYQVHVWHVSCSLLGLKKSLHEDFFEQAT